MEEALYARPLKAPADNFTRRILARIREEKAPAASTGWTLQAWAYAASLAALLFGLYQWLDSSKWTFLSGRMTQILARIGPGEGTLISDEPFFTGDVLRGTFQNLAALVNPEAWRVPPPDSLTIVQRIGLVEAGAAMMLITVAWSLYLLFADRGSSLMAE